MSGIVAHRGLLLGGAEVKIGGAVHGGVNQETYSLVLTATGASGSVAWSIASGTLPAGLHLNPSTGAITGVPNDSNGQYTATVRAEDEDGNAAERTIVIPIGTMVSLLHMDGSNGATSITDATSRSWTRGGTATLSTANPKFGSAASLHDAAGERWTTPSAADFDFSATPFTVRVWARPTSATAASQFRGVVASRYTGSVDKGNWALYQSQSGGAWFFEVPTTSDGAWTASTGVSLPGGAPAINTYQHLAIGIDGDKYIFGARDGAVVRSSSPLAQVAYASDAPISVGTYGLFTGASNSFAGQIDEVSIVRGAWLYPQAFTVPTAASDYPQSPAALAVNGSLPAGSDGVAYSSTTDIDIHGSASPFSVSVVSGSLPGDWVASVSGSNVEVTGSGVAAGAYTFTLRVTDASMNTADLPVTVHVV
jgi:hypothetical protein